MNLLRHFDTSMVKTYGNGPLLNEMFNEADFITVPEINFISV